LKKLLFIPILCLVIFPLGCSSTSTDYSNGKAVSNNVSESPSPTPASSIVVSTPTAVPTTSPTPTPTATPTPNPTATHMPTPQPTPKKPDLELVESHAVHEKYSGFIAGTVKNNGNRSYSYVVVHINLYDNDGNQVGSTLANTSNLEASGTWKFKALVITDNVTRYKIVNVESR
jgi:hypothetical protein